GGGGMNVDEKLRAIRDVIQQDVGNRGLARDPKDNLITACSDDFANACRSIANDRDPALAIVTGFFIPAGVPPAGETDGPLGAVFLIRAMRALEIPAVTVTDDFCLKALNSGTRLAGLADCTMTFFVSKRSVIWCPPPGVESKETTTHKLALERVG